MTAWTDFLKTQRRGKLPYREWLKKMSKLWKKKKTVQPSIKRVSTLPPPSTETIVITETIKDKIKRLPDLCRDLEKLRTTLPS